MLTASHHPWQLNGLKFFLPEGGIGFHELDELLDMAQSLEKTEAVATGRISQRPFLPTYENHLKQLIINGVDPEVQKPLLGLHVVVEQAPFEPEAGAYGGGHSHGHYHDHDHAHSHDH